MPASPLLLSGEELESERRSKKRWGSRVFRDFLGLHIGSCYELVAILVSWGSNLGVGTLSLTGAMVAIGDRSPQLEP